MNTRVIALLSVILVSVFLSLHTHANINLDGPTQKFIVSDGYVITVPVYVNNQGPFPFLLDTGSTTTAIEKTLASQLQLQVNQGAMLTTTGGNSLTGYAYLQKVSIGSASANNIACLVIDLAEVQRHDASIRGILGGNFLTQFNFLLDYKSQTITFEKADEIGADLYGFQLQFTTNSNRAVIKAAVPNLHVEPKLVIDSAIPTVVLFKQSPYGIKDKVLTTTNGTKQVQTTTLKSMLIGPTSLSKIDALLAKDETREEDGLLPTKLFQSIYVNNKAGIIMLNPDIHPSSPTTAALVR